MVSFYKAIVKLKCKVRLLYSYGKGSVHLNSYVGNGFC